MVLYEGADRAQARKALEQQLRLLQAEYGETAEREGGTVRTTVTYGGGARAGLQMRVRVSVAGTNYDGWSRVVWSS